ncbi:MAG: PAS domain-containing protein, partial [Promethearchaeia archaeon]
MPWESDLLMCALQNLTVGVAVLDDKGRVIFANEMLASMLDISHDELKGSTFPHIEALEKTAPTQFRVVNRDGDERTLMASVSPM